MKTPAIFASVLAASTVVLGSISLAAGPSFNLQCGSATIVTKEITFKNSVLSYEQNSTSKPLLLSEGQECTVNSMVGYEFGAFCRSQNKFVASDSTFTNGALRQTEYTVYHVSMTGSAGVSRSEYKIKKSGPNLYFTAINNLNTPFKPHVQTMLVPMTDPSTTCSILPFNYSEDSGC